MESITITGGARLRGEVRVGGAKNAALPILAATLLAPGEHRVRNVPRLRDVDTMGRLLTVLGARVERSGGDLLVTSGPFSGEEAPYDLVKTMRASVLVLGPLLARTGRARVSLPGGCAIGERPVNLHLAAMRALGAEISLEHGYISARAERLRGARLHFEKQTVTGTENALMAAVLAEGATEIGNAACEPEITDLARALAGMGARISGAGTPTISVHGVERLSPVDHVVMPDRIEAGTLLLAAAITRGDVLVEGAEPAHLGAVIAKLREAGARVEETPRGLRVEGPGRPRAVDIKTGPYPEFPTDMQAQFMALLAVSRGLGVVHETIFENRYVHAAELKRLGADITLDGNLALVRGRPGLSGARVMATDLRASASLVLAGLRAEGETVVARAYHLDRGYERLDEKLGGLGATTGRIRENP
ncbi:MAG TPA: UDP-N-acetylglucosamine 1-carboxyvinyltransferase [Candidatus Methanoperedens sp.]|nr:UDP-N-acetylglucosamine 1-carboxyvinyltransferase [Candidatus Methanoperedens sp.]